VVGKVGWVALCAPIGLVSYFLMALGAYLVLRSRGRIPVDRDMADRGATSWAGRWLGGYLLWAIQPLWAGAVRLGLPPWFFTALGLFLAAVAGVAAACGECGWGGWLYLFAGICDVLDGRCARRQQRASKSGALLDAVADRYGEAFVLIGLTYFYRSSWVMLLAQAAMVGSFMVSYARAKAEGFGLPFVGGLMQRAERLVLLGLAMAASPFVDLATEGVPLGIAHPVTVVVLGVLAISANATAIFRLRRAVAGLSAGGAPLLPHGVAFPRSVVSSVVATALDFGVVTSLVAMLGMDAALATCLGAMAGAIANFSMNRLWAFDAGRGSGTSQALRYAVVSGSSALLNSAGVSLLQLAPLLDYRIAWGIVRIIVYVGWNYPLQRAWVFVRSAEPAPVMRPAPPAHPQRRGVETRADR
jgi:phosphatidylglycerophosphate synthase/putative flippase GtrA